MDDAITGDDAEGAARRTARLHDVARMERSAIRETPVAATPSPDFTALHPGYLAT